MLKSIKDSIRNVRYSIRAEIQTPGAMLPKTVASVDLKPLIAAGSVVSSPAFKVVDALFNCVESFASEVTKQSDEAMVFPTSIHKFFAEDASFCRLLYQPYQRLLLARGARNVFISEHAFDRAQTEFRTRFEDAVRSNVGQNCAALLIVLSEARPIRKLDIDTGIGGSPQLLLDPNLYCAAVFCIVTALMTRDRDLKHDLASVQESVEWVVNARLDRFKRAVTGRSPLADLTSQFDLMLPFLP